MSIGFIKHARSQSMGVDLEHNMKPELVSAATVLLLKLAQELRLLGTFSPLSDADRVDASLDSWRRTEGIGSARARGQRADWRPCPR